MCVDNRCIIQYEFLLFCYFPPYFLVSMSFAVCVFLSLFNGFIEIIKNAYLNGSTMEKPMKHKPKSVEYWFLCEWPCLYFFLCLSAQLVYSTRIFTIFDNKSQKKVNYKHALVRSWAYYSVQMNRQIWYMCVRVCVCTNVFYIKSNEICDSFDLNRHIEVNCMSFSAHFRHGN